MTSWRGGVTFLISSQGLSPTPTVHRFELVLRIRRQRQGEFHVQLAFAYVHQADAFWLAHDFGAVVELYKRASVILEEARAPVGGDPTRAPVGGDPHVCALPAARSASPRPQSTCSPRRHFLPPPGPSAGTGNG